MGLVLSSEDVTAFVALQETLLSPLEHDSVEDWCLAVLRAAQRLLRVDRSGFLLPLEDDLRYVTETIDTTLIDAWKSRIRSIEPGAIRYGERGLEHALAFRRERKMEVSTNAQVCRLTGVVMEDLPVYHDHIKPAGIAHSRVFSVALPTGETSLGLSYSDPADDPFDEEAGLQLLSMLLPAFKAGVGSLVRLNETRHALTRAVDELGQALLVISADGRALHRSPQLEALLAADPRALQIEQAIDQVVNDTLAVRYTRRGKGASGPFRNSSGEVRTDRARYAVRAVFAGRGLLGLDDAVIVSLEQLTPVLPSPRDLVERYELTEREAQVALLMAQGLSNPDIATRLGISPHTVRHHGEWVFAKLGVRSRKALGLRLLEGSGRHTH